MKLTKEWYTLKEVGELTDTSVQMIRRQIRLKKITNIKIEAHSKFIHKHEVTHLIKEVRKKEDMSDKYYTMSEVMKILGKTRSSISSMIYRDTIKTAITVGRTTYVSKKEIDYMNKCFTNTIRNNEASKLYGLIKRDIVYMCETKLVEAYSLNDIWYINKKSIEDFIEDTKKKFGLTDSKDIVRKHLVACVNGVTGITVQEASERSGMSLNSIRKYIRDGIISANQVGLIYYIDESELDKLVNSFDGIKRKYYFSEDVYAMYSELMELLINSNTNIQETLKLFRTWGMGKLTNSKANLTSKKNNANNYANIARCIANCLKKEIWECSEKEIELLRKNMSSGSNQMFLQRFISYVNEVTGSQIDSKYKAVKLNGENRVNKKEKYTVEEWVNLRNYLIDLDAHIEKAIEDKFYAQSWLYMIWHISLAWRSDTFLQMPAVDVEEILSCKLENMDFRSITMTDSQRIINRLRRSCIPLVANKNGVKTHMVVIPKHLKATAVAICINELHRKKEKDRWTKMFFYKRMQSSDINRILPKEIPKFKSKWANKSKMTYSFRTAMNKRGRSSLAMDIQRYDRSHKMKIRGANDVTVTYLDLTNTTVDSKAITKHLFDRGVFGWQIELMLNLIKEDNNDSLIVRTKTIQAVRKEFSPLVVEGMSDYLVTMSKQADELVNELLGLGTKEIKRKLIKIAELKSPGLLKNTQCIKEVENCPYKEGEDHCLGCKYNVATNYVLESINKKLHEAIEVLSKTDDDDEIGRIKYTHLIRKMLFILMVFRRSSKELGDDYLTSFIDIKALREKISILEKTKYLVMEE